MPITIIVEDGTNVTGANSYIAVQEARDYAWIRGITLPADDDQVAAMLIRSMDYIESFRNDFKGLKTYNNQSLQWPRSHVEIDGQQFSPYEIPIELKRALSQAVVEVNAGGAFMQATTGQVVKREKVDVLETEYMTAAEAGSDVVFGSPQYPAIDAHLEPLLKSDGAFFLKTVRA